MSLKLFNNLTEKDKTKAVEDLICESTPRHDFFLMVILSVLMATFGLLLNSAAVVIGSMLIAPILSPILSLSLGVVLSDMPLIFRSVYTLIKSMVLSVVAAILVTLFFSSNLKDLTTEILARTEPSLAYGAIAVIAGLAASYAKVKPHLNETLPGVAISVALIPPLAAMGIGVARVDWFIISNSFLLFVVDVIGIIFSSMIVFSLMNLYIKRKLADKTIEKEDKAILEEQKES